MANTPAWKTDAYLPKGIARVTLGQTPKPPLLLIRLQTRLKVRSGSLGLLSVNFPEQFLIQDTGRVAMSSQSSVTTGADENKYEQEVEYQDWDETIMAQVLAESQLTYFDDLKRQVKKRNGSPGPSTSR